MYRVQLLNFNYQFMYNTLHQKIKCRKHRRFVDEKE